ncbi:hypothetical protein [Streptomyces sp. NPDC005374]|uniref:hypothetical protein n=1 Tax=Streptomyces sp. NPDC005374 TaxID=3364713 RepID=UPI0036CDF474
MDEVELLAAALALETAGLRDAVRGRLAGREDGGYGVRVLDSFAADPDVWGERLADLLTGSGAVADDELLAAARTVLGAAAHGQGRRAEAGLPSCCSVMPLWLRG